jgi:DNA mismatch endonuclease (patch repair protein)
VAKICRNKERDREEQKKLATMGWHCITVWECELKPSKREETLESIAFTLNHIWLQDRGGLMDEVRGKKEEVGGLMAYPQLEEEDVQMLMAAEEMEEV